MSGLGDDLMFELFDEMAKIPFPVEDTTVYLLARTESRKEYFRERRRRLKAS